MTSTELDELGPVDYLVIEFPAGKANFTGEIAAELARLADVELIRVLDLLIIEKNADGDVEAMELSDLPELGDLGRLETELAEILAEEDVAHLAAAMEPGTVAAALIFENTWAAPFGSAVRKAGGQLVANGRIPIQAIAASLEADTTTPGG
jgi:Family of unknown function (DUF6325)